MIGVTFDSQTQKWIAHIDNLILGYYDRECDAGLAYDYNIKQYQTNPILNFPDKPNWHDYMMSIAETVKLRSPDYYKVGAVLVSINDNRIISTGYNGFPAGMNETIDLSNRPLVYSLIIHAEMNCVLYAQSKFEDSIMYITTSPCQNCLKLIAAAKIKKIYYKHDYKDIEMVKQICNLLKIEIIQYNS